MISYFGLHRMRQITDLPLPPVCVESSSRCSWFVTSLPSSYLVWAFCSICLRRPRFISTLSASDNELPLLHTLSKLSDRQSPLCIVDPTSTWLYLRRWLSKLSDLCSSLGNLWAILEAFEHRVPSSVPTGTSMFGSTVFGLPDLQKHLEGIHGLSESDTWSPWVPQTSLIRFSTLAPSPSPRGIASKGVAWSYSLLSNWGSSSLLLEPQASVRAYPNMKVPETIVLSWVALAGSFQITLRSARDLTLDCRADTAELWVCWVEDEEGADEEPGSGLVLDGRQFSACVGSGRSLRLARSLFWEAAGRGLASSDLTASSMVKSESQRSFIVAEEMEGKEQIKCWLMLMCSFIK